MDTQIETKLLINSQGELKLKMSTMEFYVQGIRQDMFGQLCTDLTYFKS